MLQDGSCNNILDIKDPFSTVGWVVAWSCAPCTQPRKLSLWLDHKCYMTSLWLIHKCHIASQGSVWSSSVTSEHNVPQLWGKISLAYSMVIQRYPKYVTVMEKLYNLWTSKQFWHHQNVTSIGRHPFATTRHQNNSDVDHSFKLIFDYNGLNWKCLWTQYYTYIILQNWFKRVWPQMMETNRHTGKVKGNLQCLQLRGEEFLRELATVNEEQATIIHGEGRLIDCGESGWWIRYSHQHVQPWQVHRGYVWCWCQQKESHHQWKKGWDQSWSKEASKKDQEGHLTQEMEAGIKISKKLLKHNQENL